MPRIAMRERRAEVAGLPAMLTGSIGSLASVFDFCPGVRSDRQRDRRECRRSLHAGGDRERRFAAVGLTHVRPVDTSHIHRMTDRRPMPKTSAPATRDPSAVDEAIRSVTGWRGETLTTVRRLIHEVDPDIDEACKWAKPTNPSGVPVWSRAGIVCTGETYRQVVKLTFARGAALADPHGLFNAGLDGNMRRAIDLRETDVLDADVFKALIRAAIDENLRAGASKAPGRVKDPATKDRS